MVDWNAVGFGFVVGLVIGVLGLAVPGIGQIGGGLVGGFVAGYMAGGGLGRGAWHGLIAGALGGLLLAVIVGLGTLTVGLAIDAPLGVFGGAGIFVIGIILALILAIDSAIAGAVGGLLKG